jgi:hypothetical protein
MSASNWAVFARKEAAEPLTRIGTVAVDEGASVEAAVRAGHGEDWIEMVAIPETSIVWAIREESE